MPLVPSLLNRFSTKQIAVGGAVLVASLLTVAITVTSIFGWMAYANMAERREKDRIAKEKEKAVEDVGKAFAKIFSRTPKAKKEVDWLPPSKDAIVGDAKITILSGDFGTIKWEAHETGFSRRTEHTKEKTANVRIRVANTSKTKIIEYLPWHFPTVLTELIIKDEHGNKCEIWTSYSGSLVSGHKVSSHCKINPGESIEDTFAFNYPLPISNEFFIELPGRHVGTDFDKSVYFKIPRSFFEIKAAK